MLRNAGPYLLLTNERPISGSHCDTWCSFHNNAHNTVCVCMLAVSDLLHAPLLCFYTAMYEDMSFFLWISCVYVKIVLHV